MLFLQFELGQDRYVLDCSGVVEVLPLLAIKQIPQAPSGVVGAFNYRGEPVPVVSEPMSLVIDEPVPVVDLSALALGRPAQRHMSTRIVIVRHPGGNGALHLLGLIVEKATATVRRDRADFADSGVVNHEAPYLGPVAADAEGLVQWIEVANLLPATVRDVLFAQPLECE